MGSSGSKNIKGGAVEGNLGSKNIEGVAVEGTMPANDAMPAPERNRRLDADVDKRYAYSTYAFNSYGQYVRLAAQVYKRTPPSALDINHSERHAWVFGFNQRALYIQDVTVQDPVVLESIREPPCPRVLEATDLTALPDVLDADGMISTEKVKEHRSKIAPVHLAYLAGYHAACCGDIDHIYKTVPSEDNEPKPRLTWCNPHYLFKLVYPDKEGVRY